VSLPCSSTIITRRSAGLALIQTMFFWSIKPVVCCCMAAIRISLSLRVQGKSWGNGGPKRVVQEILDSLDRESILAQAREDIAQRLRY
ncbi:hypothetical protein TI03_05935, partial [Achromatium sp. WMS1]